MKLSIASVALCVASAVAAPASMGVLSSQFDATQSPLCPGAAKGSLFTDKNGNEYQIYCGYVYTGATVHNTDVDSFRGCIGKCDAWNKDHKGPKACAGLSYSKGASPQCSLYAKGFGVDKGLGVKSAVPYTGTGQKGTFVKLALPPPKNWVGGYGLWPDNVIAEYHAPIPKWNASSWSENILSKCKKIKGCTSTLTFSSRNTGTTGGHFWFGTVYGGGPTTLANYTRAYDYYQVTHSTAYTIVRK